VDIAPLPPVLGNVAALTQCFSNLLENAVKFAKPGHVPHIRVTAEPEHDWVRIVVQDDGIGIRRDLQTRIFDLFQQVNPAYAGTGVGLAIVRKAAERMGGRVGVESEEGKGSRFWVELKAAGNDVAERSLTA
jgi:signal transduction histidine kinase